MNTTEQIAKHLKEVLWGGNWTYANLKDTLKDLTWQQATTQVYSFNTIATLVYHVHYFVRAGLKVLQGKVLDSKDAESFAHPPITCQADWEAFLSEVWAESELFISLIERLPEDTLWVDFADKKYGNYYRNLHGIIEHHHYHLGQIVVIKKLIEQIGQK